MIRKIIKIDIVPFEKKYFSQLVDFVKPMWSFSTWEDSFRKIYTELILQNSFFENNLTFQIALPKDKLCSAMFFQNKSDKNI